MQQGLLLRQRASYLGKDHVAIRLSEARLQSQTEPEYTYESFAPPPTPWWQEWFPFLVEWLPWIVYYRDLADYHVQRILYFGQYLLAYCFWMLGRYKDAAQFQIRSTLYDLDSRLQRWAEDIEAQNGQGSR